MKRKQERHLKMKKVTEQFNQTQAERQLIERMKAVTSPEAIEEMKKMLEEVDPTGVLVPSVRDKDGTGYDIFSLLLKDRIVMVHDQVEAGMASIIIAQLKFLEFQGDEPIQ